MSKALLGCPRLHVGRGRKAAPNGDQTFRACETAHAASPLAHLPSPLSSGTLSWHAPFCSGTWAGSDVRAWSVAFRNNSARADFAANSPRLTGAGYAVAAPRRAYSPAEGQASQCRTGSPPVLSMGDCFAGDGIFLMHRGNATACIDTRGSVRVGGLNEAPAL